MWRHDKLAMIHQSSELVQYHPQDKVPMNKCDKLYIFILLTLYFLPTLP